MSSFSNWSYTARATFWRPTYDEFSQPSGWTRSEFRCSFKAGGSQPVGDTSEQFMPKQVIYLEAAVEDAPQNGDRVAIGVDTSANPPDTSDTVRMVRRYDPSTFSEGLPDYEVTTG